MVVYGPYSKDLPDAGPSDDSCLGCDLPGPQSALQAAADSAWPSYNRLQKTEHACGICVCIHISIHRDMYMCTYVYIDMYLYACVYIYTYSHIHNYTSFDWV